MTLEWIDVGTLADILPRSARCIDTPQGRIGLFRTADNQVFAIENRCPHRGGPLTEGIVHGHAVTCPLHNWAIDLDSGQALGADQGQVATWPVRLEGDRILLGLATEVTGAMGATEVTGATGATGEAASRPAIPIVEVVTG